MQLFNRKYGEGEPIIILHGLFGLSDNWVSIAKKLSNDYQIDVPDLRNHGNSPHSDEFSYDVLADDIIDFLESHSIEKANIIGHSMGGKTAIQIAAKRPGIINKLVIIDESSIKSKQFDILQLFTPTLKGEVAEYQAITKR